jgi:hypothetical protein
MRVRAEKRAEQADPSARKTQRRPAIRLYGCNTFNWQASAAV